MAPIVVIHALKGRTQSPEHIAKRVAAWRLSAGPAKSIARLVTMNKARIGEVRGQEQIEKHRAKMMGRSREWLCGRKLSEDHRRKLSAYWAEHREQHNFYVDGKGAERWGERNQARGRIEYRLWREQVFKRDNWTCVICNERGGRLEADHILPYVSHKALRYDVDNGRTVCRPCHMKFPTHGAGARKVSSEWPA